MPSTKSYDEILGSLVHDLRQPLGNIETSLFYLDLVLEHPQERVREQLRVMEQQVAQAAALLQCAAEEMHRLRAGSGPLAKPQVASTGGYPAAVYAKGKAARPDGAAEGNLARTKSATAAVT